MKCTIAIGKKLGFISLFTQPCVFHLKQYLLYLSPNVAVCSLFGVGYRVTEKGCVKMVFLLQQFLNMRFIFNKPILVLASVSSYHLCGSSKIMSLKLAQSAPTSLELRPSESSLLSISAASDCLTVLLLIQVTFSCLAVFVPCGCWEVEFWCWVWRLSVCGLSSSLHHIWPLWLWHHTSPFASQWHSTVSAKALSHDASMTSCFDGPDERWSWWWGSYVQYRFPVA